MVDYPADLRDGFAVKSDWRLPALATEQAPPVKKARTRSIDSKTLDANAWADAGLVELAAHGIDRVRVEVLAKRLGVTKGSFYWHFKDRDALLAMMLERWRRRATLQLIERLDRDSAAPLERIRSLLRLPLRGERAMQAAEVELAIRLWGRHDQRAQAALTEVDELRLHYLTQLLIDIGVPPQIAGARAILVYAFQRVAGTLIAPGDAERIQQCEALLLGTAT